MDESIKKHFPLVRSLVKRYCGEFAEEDDLFQVGCIGLIKALRKYDSELGTAFTTYAVPVITGEIKMYLRGQGALKYSRALASQAGRVKRVQNELEQRLGRQPALSELSDACGLAREELLMALDVVRLPLSLDAIEPGVQAELAVTAAESEQVVDRLALREALTYLPERERRIVLYRFFRHKSQQETAAILGISQMHVSRLEKKIINELKKQLA
ncbi:MAG: sigma-70 family RNA polymerase sigma factor [Firmicutes bacterium]|jgi:RNA polymerase sporulation-specific sigma factor|nr:sigma-70 family RNA polymerase sigma factor [Bacillota bacterium]MCL5994105.1 sigma-70 family RNA polymerase sigma factor [Bacillota bacterium]